MTERRLVAVLGYSNRSLHGLHPVCAARLACAREEAEPGDVVLLSGRSRGRRAVPEAELMARAWGVPASRLVVDRNARSTFGNVRGVAAAARALAVGEVVLVTSGWHGRRASVLLRAALRGGGLRVTLAATAERGTLGAHVRELACWPLVPLQAAFAGRRR